VIQPDFFKDQVTLETVNLRLEPLGPEHFEGSWAALQDEEGRRLTGTHATFTEEQIRGWLASRADEHDRADWAILRKDTGAYVGEVVLNDLDPHNESMGFRIALGGAAVFGKGYGSEATQAVVEYGLEVVGLHRISLEVVDFNTRAQRVYAKAGFHPEGILRDAWYWDGEWSDVIVMAVLADH
jgi:RimJ/RimL family protein N-acetyltransferase